MQTRIEKLAASLKFSGGCLALLLCLFACDLGKAPIIAPGLSDTPSAPLNVATVAGFSQITVSWEVPELAGGTPLKGYKVTVVEDTTKQCSTTTELSCAVTGLVNGVSYTFEVVAINGFGAGTPSAPTEPLAPVGGSEVPTAPLNVVATADNGRVTISWKAPANGGGSPIVLYEVTSLQGSAIHCETTGARFCTVTGLTNGNQYSFTVRASNQFGAGPASEVSNLATPGILPVEPAGVAIAAGNGQVTVSWASSGGATSFKVLGMTDSTKFCLTEGSSCTVTGLTNGKAYNFILRSSNSTGYGPIVYVPGPVTPHDQPIAPDAPYITFATAGDGQALITWIPPASDGGSPVTGYVVSAVQAPLKQCSTTGALTCTIAGLTSGTSYTFIVKATNAQGTGAASIPSLAVTPIVIGASWTKQSTGTGAALQGVTWTGSQLVAVGANGVAVTSPDGITWTTRTMGTASYSAVAWTGPTTGSGAGLLVAVSTNGGLATSPDGVTWTTGTAGTTRTLYGLAWTGSQVVAVGLNGTIVTSPDGLTWTTRSSGTTAALYNVASSGTGGRLVAVGADGVILTSPDGITWTADASGTASSLYGVAWTGTQFAAVGANGAILTSPDGLAWSAIEGATGTLSSVAQTGIKFIAVGSGGILYSVSGNTASALASGVNATLYGVAWNGFRAVVVGAAGTVLTSP